MTDFGDINLKFPLILDISVFMSGLNFMLSRVKHKKCLTTSGPDPQIERVYYLCVLKFAPM